MGSNGRVSNILLHAPNIHSGGGAVLLRALLDEMPADIGGHLVVDARFEGLERLPANWTVERVAPKVLSRLRSEWSLARRSAEADFVLCFGNLPPLFKPATPVAVFVQNRNLLPGAELTGFSPTVRLRHLVEWTWLRTRRRHAGVFVVQTESMKHALERALGGNICVRVHPFTPSFAPPTTDASAPRYDFVYVASGDPHKNHRTLVEAWELLAQKGRRPSLLLTIDPAHYRPLVDWIAERARALHLAIDNRGASTREEILQTYRQSRCLIFPSYSESLGLPLLEAAQLGIPILASEIDSVRDVVAPRETFDPHSAVSITRAVCRFMGWTHDRDPVSSAGEWMTALSHTPQTWGNLRET